jgi:hypothetical protein
MSDATPSWEPDKDKLYSEMCLKIRATDEISFKLLGFVPLLSGSAIFVLLFKGGALEPVPLILLCIAGVVITFGLFCWERRNIKTCSLFRDAASELEGKLEEDWLKPYSILAGKIPSEKYVSFLGKTKAEVIIYVASILVWIIPIINLLLQRCR